MAPLNSEMRIEGRVGVLRNPRCMSLASLLSGRADDAFLFDAASIRRIQAQKRQDPSFSETTVRGLSGQHEPLALFPYDTELKVLPGADIPVIKRLLWPRQHHLQVRKRFSVPIGRHQRHCLVEYTRILHSECYRTPLSITFAFVATHNHYVLDRGGKVFNRSAPVIKLPAGATEDDHLSTARYTEFVNCLFWLKQNSHNKGSTVDSRGARPLCLSGKTSYEFTGNNSEDFPLPSQRRFSPGRVSSIRCAQAVGRG